MIYPESSGKDFQRLSLIQVSELIMNIVSTSHSVMSPLFGGKRKEERLPGISRREWKKMHAREEFVNRLDNDRMLTKIGDMVLLRNIEQHPGWNKVLKDGLFDMVVPVAGDAYTEISHVNSMHKAHRLGLGWKVLMGMAALFGVDAGLDVAAGATGEISPPAIILNVTDVVPLAAVSRALLEEAARSRVKKDMELKKTMHKRFRD